MAKKEDQSLEESLFYKILTETEQKTKSVNLNRHQIQQTPFQKASQEELDGQKFSHRNELLRFARVMSFTSFITLVGFILINVFGKVFMFERGQLISDQTIQYFIIGVFAEILGVLAIIVKKVWSKE